MRRSSVDIHPGPVLHDAASFLHSHAILLGCMALLMLSAALICLLFHALARHIRIEADGVGTERPITAMRGMFHSWGSSHLR